MTDQDQPLTAQLRVNTEASTTKRLTETEFWQLVERLEIQYGLREAPVVGTKTIREV
jgi:hypothetical protein